MRQALKTRLRELAARSGRIVEFGEVAEKTNPDLWRAKVAAAKQKFGKWSARASQWAVGAYKGAGGGYRGEKSSSNSMAKWTRQKWRTRDGSKAERSDRKGRKVTARYLPDAKWKSLSPSEAAATDAKKRNASREGKQVVANTSKAKVRELARGDYINQLIHQTYLLGPSLKKYAWKQPFGVIKASGKAEAALPLWNMHDRWLAGGSKRLVINRGGKMASGELIAPKLAPMFRNAYRKLKPDLAGGKPMGFAA